MKGLFAIMDVLCLQCSNYLINWRNIKEHALIILETNEDEILDAIAAYKF